LNAFLACDFQNESEQLPLYCKFIQGLHNTYNSFDCGCKETRISTLAYNLDALFTMNMNFRICGPIHAESMVSSLEGCKVDHEVSPRYL
jgi:hypothetical protein